MSGKQVTNTGTNSQVSHKLSIPWKVWTLSQGSGYRAYSDGGYAYSNPGGSRYYNTGSGHGFYRSWVSYRAGNEGQLKPLLGPSPLLKAATTAFTFHKNLDCNLISWLLTTYPGFNGWFLNVKVVKSLQQWREGPINCEVIVKLREGYLIYRQFLSSKFVALQRLWRVPGVGRPEVQHQLQLQPGHLQHLHQRQEVEREQRRILE